MRIMLVLIFLLSNKIFAFDIEGRWNKRYCYRDQIQRYSQSFYGFLPENKIKIESKRWSYENGPCDLSNRHSTETTILQMESLKTHLGKLHFYHPTGQGTFQRSSLVKTDDILQYCSPYFCAEMSQDETPLDYHGSPLPLPGSTDYLRGGWRTVACKEEKGIFSRERISFNVESNQVHRTTDFFNNQCMGEPTHSESEDYFISVHVNRFDEIREIQLIRDDDRTSFTIEHNTMNIFDLCSYEKGCQVYVREQLRSWPMSN